MASGQGWGWGREGFKGWGGGSDGGVAKQGLGTLRGCESIWFYCALSTLEGFSESNVINLFFVIIKATTTRMDI